jgi:hypothetical protein
MTGPQKPHASMSPRAVLGVVLGAGLLLGAYYGFIVTHGTMRFVGHEPGYRIYWGMWRSLAQGRFDLDPADVQVEAFHRDGKTYTYYGIFPAFVRGAASLFGPPDRGGVSQISCVLAGLTAVLGFLWAGLVLGLHRGARRIPFVLLMVTLALATPVVISLALADIYNEAVLWGGAWGCLFNAFLIVFAESPREAPRARASLVGMAVSAGLSLLSRATTGFFAGLELIGLAAWMLSDGRRRKDASPDRRTLAIAAICYAALLAFAGIVNHARWGNPLQFRPLQLQEAFENKPRGEVEAREGLFRLNRIATSACFYFWPATGALQRRWPFVSVYGNGCFEGSHAQTIESGDAKEGDGSPYYDLIDSVRMPLAIGSPALLLFAFMGIARMRFRPPLSLRDRVGILLAASGLAALAFFLTLDTLALRYEVDLLPALAGFGFFGVLSLPGEGGVRARSRFAVTAAAALLVAFSIFSTHITMLVTKTIRGGVPGSIRVAAEALLRP